MQLQFFNADESYEVVERRLPHWSQSGAVSFITWRTWDSMPFEVLSSWKSERDQWLLRHGIDPQRSDWESKLGSLDLALRKELKSLLADRWNERLDQCHGECVLRDGRLAKIVADSLLHFDGDRYDLTDFVVMPNHVHVLAAFPDDGALLKQCESWKHFTALPSIGCCSERGDFGSRTGSITWFVRRFNSSF